MTTTRASLRLLSRQASPGRRALPDDFLDLIWRGRRPGTWPALLDLYRSADPDRLAAAGSRLGELSCPALVVWGRADPYIPVRFGRAYAADVFHDNPLTGKSYIVLTDIVYYLIFAAYILMTAHFVPNPEWNTGAAGLVTGEQLGAAALRVGGILLVIGALHGINIVLMPVLGRLFSLNRKLSAEQRDPLRYP